MKREQFQHDGFNHPSEQERAAMRQFDTHAPIQANNLPSDPRLGQLLMLFNQLDDRGKTTMLAMLAVAVKLHPKV